MIFNSAPAGHIKKEREKARKLRLSSWWKNKIKEGVCYLCGNSFDSKDLTMEHLTPLSRGGLSIKNNLVVACKGCNTKKKHQTIVEKRLQNV